MDNRGPRRQLDLHRAVQERDGGVWTRMMAMQMGEAARFQEIWSVMT